MQKKIFLFLILILISGFSFGLDFYKVERTFLNVYDKFDRIGLNYLPASYDLNYSDAGEFDNALTIGLVLWNFETSNTGLGFEIIPLQYHYIFNNHMFSLFNFKLHWNILNLFTDKLNIPFFGPYVSIDYPNYYLQENFMISDYIFKAGLRYSLRKWFIMEEPFLPAIASMEMGYKNVSGVNQYYVSVQIGLFSPFYTWLTILEEYY